MITVFWNGESWNVSKGVEAFDNFVLQASKLSINEGFISKNLKFEEDEEDL